MSNNAQPHSRVFTGSILILQIALAVTYVFAVMVSTSHYRMGGFMNFNLQYPVGAFFIAVSIIPLCVFGVVRSSWRTYSLFSWAVWWGVWFDRFARPPDPDADRYSAPEFMYGMIFGSIVLLVVSAAWGYTRARPDPDRKRRVFIDQALFALLLVAGLALLQFGYVRDARLARRAAYSEKIRKQNADADQRRRDREAEERRNAPPNVDLSTLRGAGVHKTLQGYASENEDGEWTVWINLDGPKLVATIPAMTCESDDHTTRTTFETQTVLDLDAVSNMKIWLSFDAGGDAWLVGRSQTCERAQVIQLAESPTDDPIRQGRDLIWRRTERVVDETTRCVRITDWVVKARHETPEQRRQPLRWTIVGTHSQTAPDRDCGTR